GPRRTGDVEVQVDRGTGKRMQAKPAGNKPTIVVGLGQTGLSCARYLHRRQEDFIVVDSRESPPCLAEFRKDMPDVMLELGGSHEAMMLGAGTLVRSPGVVMSHRAQRKAADAEVTETGDIDIFARQVNAHIVAVTGSNGKSTVVTLFGEMAK